MRVSTRLFIVAFVVGPYAGWLSYLHNAARGWPWHDSLSCASIMAVVVAAAPVLIGLIYRSEGE